METTLRRLNRSPAAPIAGGAAFLLLQAAPVALGLAFLLMPAFGFFPALGAHDFNLDPWRQALAEPGLARSIGTALLSGLGASAVALAFAVAIAARLAPKGEISAASGNPALAFFYAVIATPPVALAAGLGFLIAPSGWIARSVGSVFAWEQPPQWLAPHDPWGASLCLGLILKETPFLTVAALAAIRQMQAQKIIAVAAGLGYAPSAAWAKIIAPDLVVRLRWPFFAVLAYGLSTVDLSIVLGPTAPSTLPVAISDLARDPDLARRMPASALALVQAGLVVAAWIGCASVARAAMGLFLRAWRVDGARELPRRACAIMARSADTIAAIGGLAIVLSLADLLLWSFALAWRYPDVLPQCCSLSTWARAAEASRMPLLTSIFLGMASSLLAVVLAIVFLTLERRWSSSARRWLWNSVFLPLVAPDICFVLGMQIFFLALGWRSGLPPVLWAHFLFVFPYALMTMADSWRRLDPRFELVAATLGASPLDRLLRVRLPLLAPVLALALGLGIAVSLSLYLPTVLLGAGRVQTLTTEAVALSSGGDRRIVGAYAMAQTLLAWACLAGAAASARRRWKGFERR